MGVSVDSSRIAAFVREFAATPDASAATLPKAAQKAGLEDRVVREALAFWTYLENTHGGRRAAQRHIRSSGSSLESEIGSHNTGRALGDLGEAAEALRMQQGLEGLEQARETIMARNLTILAGELHDYVAQLLEQLTGAVTAEKLLAAVERARAAPPEDAPTPAKLALLATWIRESKEARAPTEKELQWFLLNGEAFAMVFSSSIRAAALWGGNEATGLMLENVNTLAAMLQELGFGFGGKKRRGSLALTAQETRAMEEDGVIPEHLKTSTGGVLNDALDALSSNDEPMGVDLFGALGQSRSLKSFVDEAKIGLDTVWKKSGSLDQVLKHLDSIADNESPDAVEVLSPWQAKMIAGYLREDPERRGKPGAAPSEAHLQEFLRNPEAVQDYLRPDSFCSNFATAFCAYTVQMTGAILSGIQALERSH